MPDFASFALELQTNVKHGISGSGDVIAPLAFDFTLQEPVEGRMHDADAGQLGRATGCRMDVVQSGNEAFVSVLL